MANGRRIEISIPPHSAELQARLAARLKDRLPSCDLVFVERDVEHARLASTEGDEPAVYEQIKQLLAQYERQFMAATSDANQEALEQVQKATESGPVDGEELLGSEELKRQYREANRPQPSPGPSPASEK